MFCIRMIWRKRKIKYKFQSGPHNVVATPPPSRGRAGAYD